MTRHLEKTGLLKEYAEVDAVKPSQLKFQMKYMDVSVNATWVVIAGGGIGTALAGMRTVALASASESMNARTRNVQYEGENEADAEVTYRDLRNSSASY